MENHKQMQICIWIPNQNSCQLISAADLWGYVFVDSNVATFYRMITRLIFIVSQPIKLVVVVVDDDANVVIVKLQT